MVYVQRNAEGKVNAVYLQPQFPGMEKINSQHQDIVDYLRTCEQVEIFNQLLTESDTSITRVIEDLINLLIEKKVINFTELPIHAQNKLQHRQAMRQNREKIQLLVDDIV